MTKRTSSHRAHPSKPLLGEISTEWVDAVSLPLGQAISTIELATAELDAANVSPRQNELYLAIQAGVDLLKKAKVTLEAT